MTPAPGNKTWTLDEANRAIVYLAPIARDMIREFARLAELRRLRSDAHPEHAEVLTIRIEVCEAALTALERECRKVGVDVLDVGRGRLGFPACIGDDETVILLWEHGDPEVAAWKHRFDNLIRPLAELPPELPLGPRPLAPGPHPRKAPHGRDARPRNNTL